MAFLSSVGEGSSGGVEEGRPLVSPLEQQESCITRGIRKITNLRTAGNFILPVTLAATCVLGLYVFRSKGWVVLSLTLAAALQLQLLVSLNAPQDKRENAHDATMKVALAVFMIFWFTYTLNSKQHWAQDLMLLPVLITAACFYRQIYDEGVRMHQLITRPTFKALNAWAGKTVTVVSVTTSYWQRLKDNNFICTCVQQTVWAGASTGLLIGGHYISGPGRFLTDLTGWALAGKAVATPLSVLFLSKVEYEKQKIDGEWKRGQLQDPVLSRTVKVLIPTTGALDALADVTAAVTFVYSIKTSAFKVAAVSGGLLAWKGTQAWHSLKNREVVEINENTLQRAKYIAWTCTSIFALAIPAYTITQAVLYRDPVTIVTAMNILVNSYLSYGASKAVQRKWTPENTSIVLRFFRYILSEYPDVWAYLAAGFNHAGNKVPGMPLKLFWQQLGWGAQATLIGGNLADLDDFLHDSQTYQMPRLGALITMYVVSWSADIPSVFKA